MGARGSLRAASSAGRCSSSWARRTKTEISSEWQNSGEEGRPMRDAPSRAEAQANGDSVLHEERSDHQHVVRSDHKHGSDANYSQPSEMSRVSGTSAPTPTRAPVGGGRRTSSTHMLHAERTGQAAIPGGIIPGMAQADQGTDSRPFTVPQATGRDGGATSSGGGLTAHALATQGDELLDGSLGGGGSLGGDGRLMTALAPSSACSAAI